MAKKILVSVGYKSRELEYLSVLTLHLQRAGHEVVLQYSNYEFYAKVWWWQPDVVILGQVNQAENIAMAEYAVASGAHVVILNCEGTYHPEKVVRRFGQQSNHCVTIMTAWGQQHAQDAPRFSDIPPEKVVITGTPKFDLYAKPLEKYFAKHPPYRALLHKRRPTICVCTSFASADDNWEHVKANHVYAAVGKEQSIKVIRGQQQLRDDFIRLALMLHQEGKYNIIFRAHPLENHQYYRDRLPATQKGFVMDTSVPPAQLFSVLDLLIHRTSTIATEAWIAGILTVSLDTIANDDWEMLPFTKHNLVFSTVERTVTYVQKHDFRRRGKDPLLQKKRDYLCHWYNLCQKQQPLASEKVTDLVTGLPAQPRRRVFHRLLAVNAALFLGMLLLRRKRTYEVIALLKGAAYLHVVRANDISPQEVARRVRFYATVFPMSKNRRRKVSLSKKSSSSLKSLPLRTQQKKQPEQRAARQGRVVWLTGLSGSGKSTIAHALLEKLHAEGYRAKIIDGDDVRATLHKHLGFSRADILENNRLVAGLCQDALHEYDILLVPVIAPFAASRTAARQQLGRAYVEVHVATPLEVCIDRDVKGLYKKALKGEIANFIGVDAATPYEVPKKPDLRLDTTNQSLTESVELLWQYLKLDKRRLS